MRKLRDRRGITLTEMLCTVLIVLLLTALLKLSDRFDDDMLPRIVSMLDYFRTSSDLELQQRACESWYSLF